MYRYEPCNVGNIRKMVIVMPSVQPQLAPQAMSKFEQVAEKPEAIYQYA